MLENIESQFNTCYFSNILPLSGVVKQIYVITSQNIFSNIGNFSPQKVMQVQ